MVLVGPLAEVIPMPVIGGELIWGRRTDVRLVLRTAPLPAVAMVVTFLATTQLPLQAAIPLGGLSLLLYCAAPGAAGLPGAGRPGRWRIAPVPDEAPSGAVTVLLYAGTGLFAEVARVDERWPRTARTRNAAIFLSVRTLPDIPSSTLLAALGHRADALRARGSAS